MWPRWDTNAQRLQVAVAQGLRHGLVYIAPSGLKNSHLNHNKLIVIRGPIHGNSRPKNNLIVTTTMIIDARYEGAIGEMATLRQVEIWPSLGIGGGEMGGAAGVEVC